MNQPDYFALIAAEMLHDLAQLPGMYASVANDNPLYVSGASACSSRLVARPLRVNASSATPLLEQRASDPSQRGFGPRPCTRRLHIDRCDEGNWLCEREHGRVRPRATTIGNVFHGVMTSESSAGQRPPTPWWLMVLLGLLLIALGVGALLAYSYWGGEGRSELMAVTFPLFGLVSLTWGVGRGARGAARRIAGRSCERRAERRVS